MEETTLGKQGPCERRLMFDESYPHRLYQAKVCNSCCSGHSITWSKIEARTADASYVTEGKGAARACAI